MNFTPNDTEALMNLLSWRRDVRHFKSDPIPEEDVATLLSAIHLAPSVGNSRPWRFVKIQNMSIQASIFDNYVQANQEAAGVYTGKERSAYDHLKLAGLKEAPLHLAVFTDPDPIAGKGLGRQTMPETLSYSTVMAIHTLWLVARTMNIGVGWVSILNPSPFKTLLELPQSWQFNGYLCVGYPDFSSQTPELAEKGWQENTSTQWIER